jgi:hypothetical protein
MRPAHRLMLVAALGLGAGCGGATAGAADIYASQVRSLIEQCEVRRVSFERGSIFLELRSGDTVRYADDETEAGRSVLSEALSSVPERCDPIQTHVER